MGPAFGLAVWCFVVVCVISVNVEILGFPCSLWHLLQTAITAADIHYYFYGRTGIVELDFPSYGSRCAAWGETFDDLVQVHFLPALPVGLSSALSTAACTLRMVTSDEYRVL